MFKSVYLFLKNRVKTSRFGTPPLVMSRSHRANTKTVRKTHWNCRTSPRHCRPYSRGRRRSASGWGCSGRSCTGTGRCRTSNRSRAAEGHRRRGISVRAHKERLLERVFFNFFLLPRPIRQRSRDRRRTSTCRRCSGRWCRQTRSRSTGEALQWNRGSVNTEARHVDDCSGCWVVQWEVLVPSLNPGKSARGLFSNVRSNNPL